MQITGAELECGRLRRVAAFESSPPDESVRLADADMSAHSKNTKQIDPH